jgi:uncharacterized repeat protein (TIGR03803 family)
MSLQTILSVHLSASPISVRPFLRLSAFAFAILLGLAVTPRIAQGQTETVLHSFANNRQDGASPNAGLMRDSAGNLYGTTLWGGVHNWGTVYKINKNGTASILYSFTGGTDGANPDASVIRDSAGNLYGTAGTGGDLTCTNFEPNSGCGTIFKLDGSGHLTVLYTFIGTPDGEFPQGGLVRDAKGNLYGTTAGGGGTGTYCFSGCGTVFKLDASGNETVLYTFLGTTDGNSPRAGVRARRSRQDLRDDVSWRRP